MDPHDAIPQPQATPPAQAGLGLLGMATSAATGLLAGGATMVTSVNHYLKTNIREAFKPKFDFLEGLKPVASAKDKATGPVVPADDLLPPPTYTGNVKKTAVKRAAAVDKALIDTPLAEATPTVTALRDEKTVLGQAHKAMHKEKYGWFSGWKKEHVGKLKTSIEPLVEAAKNGLAADEVTRQIEQKVVEVAGQRLEGEISAIVSQVPLEKKLLMSSELHLTGGQKWKAGLAVTAATVAVGAIHHLGMKLFSDKTPAEAGAPTR